MRLLKPLIVLMAFPWLFEGQIPAPQIPLSGNIGCVGFPCLNNGILTMTDASRAMTAQETSAAGGFKVTGTWTANRTLTMPAGRFQFMAVENATTGGFSLILASASGGTSLTIANGQTATGVWFDGTNVKGTLTSAGGPFIQTNAGVNSLTGNTQITNGSVGYLTLGSPSTPFSTLTGLSSIQLAGPNFANYVYTDTAAPSGNASSRTIYRYDGGPIGVGSNCVVNLGCWELEMMGDALLTEFPAIEVTRNGATVTGIFFDAPVTNTSSVSAPTLQISQHIAFTGTNQPLLSACTGGSLTATSTDQAFHIIGLSGGSGTCTATFSSPIHAGVCTANAVDAAAPTEFQNISPIATTSSVVFYFSTGAPATTDIYAICF